LSQALIPGFDDVVCDCQSITAIGLGLGAWGLGLGAWGLRLRSAVSVSIELFPPVRDGFYRQGLEDLLMPEKPHKHSLSSKTGKV